MSGRVRYGRKMNDKEPLVLVPSVVILTSFGLACSAAVKLLTITFQELVG